MDKTRNIGMEKSFSIVQIAFQLDHKDVSKSSFQEILCKFQMVNTGMIDIVECEIFVLFVRDQFQEDYINVLVN